MTNTHKHNFIRIIQPFLLLFFTVLQGQTGVFVPQMAGVDNSIQQFMQQWGLNAGSIAITKNGKLIYNRAFGTSDQKTGRPAQPNDLYRIASISKPITSIAIMKLVQEGKLDMDAKVFGADRIINDPYYLEKVKDPRVYDITVRHLLEHTAGWDRTVPYGPYRHSDPPFFPLHVTAVEEAPNPVGDSTLIRFKLGNGLHFAPGTHYSYSNVGYLVLGKIIEKISGLKYEHFVKLNLLEPISAHDMQLGKNLKKDRHEREVEYVNNSTSLSCYGDNRYVPSQYGGFNLEAMNAHGGWISSASDLTKLLLAVDGIDTANDLLSPEMVKLMTVPGEVNRNYAKGWSVNARNNWWHTGSLDGSSAFVGRTADGYTWAFLFNGRSDNSSAFWNALDRLPWMALKTINEIPEIDLFAPGKNAGLVKVQPLKPGIVNVTWNNGSGDNRMVVLSKTPVTEFPIDGITYRANDEFGKGAAIGKDNFVMYSGSGREVTLKNLDPSKKYYLTVFEYNKNSATANSEVYKLAQRDSLVLQADQWMRY